MRCYETSEMGSVIKYRTHVVLCLVITFGVCHKDQQKNVPMDLKVVSFTLAVKNQSSSCLNLLFASFYELILFFVYVNILGFKLKTL